MVLLCGVVCVILSLAVLIQYRSVTDTQTHTHRHTTTAYTALSKASRGKNQLLCRFNLLVKFHMQTGGSGRLTSCSLTVKKDEDFDMHITWISNFQHWLLSMSITGPHSTCIRLISLTSTSLVTSAKPPMERKCNQTSNQRQA